MNQGKYDWLVLRAQSISAETMLLNSSSPAMGEIEGLWSVIGHQAELIRKLEERLDGAEVKEVHDGSSS